MNDNYNENDLEALEEDNSEVEVQKARPNDGGKTEIVGIRFKKSGKTYYFAPNGFTLAEDDRVIVDTARGQEYGFTAVTNREINNSEICEPLRCVIRLATEEDTKTHEENVKKEIDAFNACIALIDKHRLGMKLIDAELSFDRSKLLFYFSAEGRVDFRELVKDLASAFHTRIEMRQIGIRDEAKILGGLGICGRPYCCNTFLSDFGQVSVKMAKEQNLSLNSAKISGSCGRLMCCLRYEYDTYLAEKALTPKVDSRVVTPNGTGIVVAANPLAGIVKVRLDAAGDDAEPVVFVREDVVDETKYEGQTLVKTDIPDRKHRDDELPKIASVITPMVPEAPAPIQASAPEKEETVEPVTENTVESEQPASQNQGERRHNRHRHKKHGNRAPEQRDQKEPRPERKDNDSDPTAQKREENGEKNEHHNNHNNHKKHNNRHRHNGDHQKQGQPSGAPKQNPNDQAPQKSEGEGGAQHQKKKFFKPYYKHGKNKKPQGGGEAKG